MSNPTVPVAYTSPWCGSIRSSRNVTIYYNRGDKAMVVSDYTKGNPERLGGSGAGHPALLHNKVHQSYNRKLWIVVPVTSPTYPAT